MSCPIDEMEPPINQMKATMNNRDLWIFGTDTRNELRYPYSTWWSNRVNGNFGSRCGSTIISRDAVLTAGHCVHSGVGCYTDLDFTPAQYELHKPYGRLRSVCATLPLTPRGAGINPFRMALQSFVTIC